MPIRTTVCSRWSIISGFGRKGNLDTVDGISVLNTDCSSTGFTSRPSGSGGNHRNPVFNNTDNLFLPFPGYQRFLHVAYFFAIFLAMGDMAR